MQKTIFDIIEEEGTIFKNRDVFDLEYIPDDFEFRDSQLNTMILNSKKIKYGKAPNNMLLKGPNSTGKTSTVKRYFKLINEYFENVIPIYINCQVYRTEYSIFSKIYKNLFNKSVANLNSVDFHDEIMEYLIAEEKILIIALDDYEVIKDSVELNRTLYTFLRAHETYPKVQICVIPITSKKENIFLNLNVSTILLPNEIRFHIYRREEIAKILTQRVELGFYPHVVSHKYLSNLIEQTYIKGNIRYGIKQLAKDGELAEFNGNSRL